jgi:anti-sigma regulatory factor (Ser/Thr protein kinase)
MIPMAPPRPSRHSTAIPQQALSASGQASSRQPMDCRVSLTSDVEAASEARAWLRAVISAWGLRVDADVAVLLASELVTNAVTHGDDGVGGAKDSETVEGTDRAQSADQVEGADGAAEVIAMCVRCLNGELRVEVHDRSPVMPIPAPLTADDDSETGRGLMLVDTLAAEWGFYGTPEGKVVYFTLPFEAEPFETGPFGTDPFGTGPFETRPFETGSFGTG